MPLAKKHDISQVSELLAKAYLYNPALNKMFGGTASVDDLKRLFSVLLPPLIKHEAVFISDNGLGVGVMTHDHILKYFSIKLARLRVLLTVVGLKNGLNYLKQQRVIDAQRLKENHLYFWMLAVHPNNNGLDAIVSIREWAFKTADRYQLPILAETPLKRTKDLYVRYGFNVYNQTNFDNGLSFWLLKRPANL